MAKKKNKEITCSFCGKTPSEQTKIISGENGYICNHCVDHCKDIFDAEIPGASNKVEASKKKIQNSSKRKLATPKQIHAHLDDYVIGHDDAKKILSVAVYNHYKRIFHNIEIENSDLELDKSNILLMGPTGSGKTLLASTLAKIVDVPFAIADATTLTEAGYVGDDVENILLRLIQNAKFDIKKAERGIIFVDEIDKITRKSENASITRDVSGEGVQQALLKIIEGTVATVPSQGGRKHPQSSNIEINTKNILFICGGAFVELEKIIKSRVKTQTIGFDAKIQDKEELEKTNFLADTVPHDLVKFGLIPELVGRLPVITSLQELDEEALLRILTEPKNALVKQFKLLMEMEKIKLTFQKDALLWIIKKAKKLKTGARGLRSIIEKIMTPIMYEAPGSNIKQIEITEKAILEDNFFSKKDKDPKSIA